jgi:hypothetical protein
MKESAKLRQVIVNRLQVLIGLASLVFGTLVYLFYRPPDQTYFIYISGLNISSYNTLPNIFGIVGGSLPSFIHVLSFILITAGFLFCQKRGCVIICLSWFLIACAFEVGQGFKPWPSEIFPDWFEGIVFLENSREYFARGTFDFMDLFAIALGTVTAYCVLLAISKRRVVS